MGTVDQAVAGADVITTCTADKTHNTILQPWHVKPGQHVNAIGGDCPGKTELAREVVESASVFVEFEPQTRVEGEIQQLDRSFPVIEFHRVLNGEHPGRVSAGEVTVFDSVGFALEDYVALDFLNKKTSELGLFKTVELVTDLDDPKDLYSLVLQPAPVPA